MRATLAAVGALAVLLVFSSPAGAQTAPEIEWIDGADAYEVAVAAVGGDCRSLVDSHGSIGLALATGENWPDALAASALDRPLLLSGRASLHAAVRQFLQGCPGSVHIVILGGTSAISQHIQDELVALGASVQRIAGADRYETARMIAEFAAPSQVSQVYLATGANFADAIAAAPRVTTSTPILLTPKAALGADASAFLSARLPANGQVVILGGTAAVSQAVLNQVRELKFNPRRIAGADRYSTAALIAHESLSDPRCGPVTDIALASGTDPYSGLAAASVRNPCQPLLLAPPSGTNVPKAVADFAETWAYALASQPGLIRTVTAVGPRMAVSSQALQQLTGIEPRDGSSSTDDDPQEADGEQFRNDYVEPLWLQQQNAASRWWQQRRGDLAVNVHLCVERGLEHHFTRANLTEYAAHYNRVVAPFYAWQSSGLLRVRFQPGEIIASQELAQGKTQSEWRRELAPDECFDKAIPSEAAVAHAFLVYIGNADVQTWSGGLGALGGPVSSTFIRHNPDSRLTPAQRPLDARSTFVVEHELDHNVGARHHNGVQFGHIRLPTAPGLAAHVGSLDGYPDIDRLKGSSTSANGEAIELHSVFPCYELALAGWPMGDGHPACSRLAPPQVQDLSIRNEPDGRVRIAWAKPAAWPNPEPVTGYKIDVYAASQSDSAPIVSETVPANATSLVLPAREIDGTVYEVTVVATSAVGDGDLDFPVPFQFLPPAAQATATQRDTRGHEVSVGGSPTPVRNPIEFDLSWPPAPGASHYVVSGFENCTIRTELDDGRGNTSFEACSQQANGTMHSLTELHDELVEGKSYDITVFACGDIYDTIAINRAAPSGCFRYATATITATRLETPPPGEISVVPVANCFATNVCYKVSWTPHPEAMAYAASYSWCTDSATQCDPLAAGLSTVIGDEAYSVTSTEASTTLTIFTEDGPAQGGRYLVRVYACYASVDPHACWGSQGSWLVGETWVTIPNSGS